MDNTTSGRPEKSHKSKKPRKPLGRLGSALIALWITAILGGICYYAFLPPINLHSEEFFVFCFGLCLFYALSSLCLSRVRKGENEDRLDLFRKAKRRCLPAAIAAGTLAAVWIVGALAGAPFFRAGDYYELLEVKTGIFTKDVAEISYNEIPMLDEDSAERLGDRKMGELGDLVSQFEVADRYTQINYQGRPVRVTYLEYGDFFKWLGNRGEGLPAYITVDMVTQEADVVRLGEGMKYSPSERFNRKLQRHLRFQYPTYMFGEPTFEIDESGYPYWVCPKVEKTIGLFGGEDIHGAVLVDAITGECTYYEEAPSWVDRVYLASLIMQQYNYHGTYVNGFLNSIFGQKDVTITTEGYNYIALGDDVYMYTGVTSITSDQSNVGFLLSNQRTKETVYYVSPGAVEESAQHSAQGVVQDLGYRATWPLLLNISGEPTYFMSLKDANELVKLYAMVNVAQYQIVSTGSSVAECEENYLKLLNQKGIAVEEEEERVTQEGYVAEIRTAVIQGNSVYFLRLEGQEVFFSLSAAENAEVVTLNVGDKVAIHYAPTTLDQGTILSGYSFDRLR